MFGPEHASSSMILLEREAELDRLDAALAAAAAGHGALLAVQGPAGSGKTALLAAMRDQSADAGIDVRSARATELESDFAFGGVRQLFSADEAAAARVVSPAVKAAEPVLAAGGASSNPPPAFAVLDGFTALLAELTVSGPVLLLLDDAHWLDVPTARWLDFLRPRIEGIGALIVIATRDVSTERMPAPLVGVVTDPSVDVIRLAPLTNQAVETLLEARFGVSPEAELVEACINATAGNAFALRELITALDDVGAEALTIYGAQQVPDAVARSVSGRLTRLDGDALPVARALAVLGDGTSPHRVSVVARLPVERVVVATDQLADADLLTDSRPLTFAHPLVRSAIEDEIPVGARSQLHSAAANQLAAEEEDPEAVAAHLLRTDPAGRARTVRWLRDAAAVAIRRGSPESAIVYLERARTEPPEPDQRVGLLHELGRAEMVARAPSCLGHLEAALQRADGPVERARVGVDVFDAMTYVGRWREALRLSAELRDELGDGDAELALALEMRSALGLIERGVGAGGEQLARVESLARKTPSGMPLLLLLALILALRGERCSEITSIVAEGLGDGSFLEDQTADSMLAVHAVDALIFVDSLADAADFAEAMCDNARGNGLVLGAVAGLTHRGLVGLRRGSLVAAETDLRSALLVAREHGLLLTLPFICSYLAETLAAQGDLAEAFATLATIPEALLEVSNAGASAVLWTRGAVHLAMGERQSARADLRACGACLAVMNANNPLLHPWRSTLALAVESEARDEAAALVAEELALARSAGLPRAIGIALRAQAELTDGELALTLLEESVAALRDSPGVLDLARTLADLGAGQRRAGRITLARQSLREALDHATRCGATGLVNRVTEELHICGARPRRPWLTGVEALTPSQVRVARLAARGLSNDEIATELTITTKTVKHHLSATYRKLDISTRHELEAALTSETD